MYVIFFFFSRNYEELLSQGRMWEQSGEYSTAIDIYLELNTQNCSDSDLLQNTWEKVGNDPADIYH